MKEGVCFAQRGSAAAMLEHHLHEQPVLALHGRHAGRVHRREERPQLSGQQRGALQRDGAALRQHDRQGLALVSGREQPAIHGGECVGSRWLCMPPPCHDRCAETRVVAVCAPFLSVLILLKTKHDDLPRQAWDRQKGKGTYRKWMLFSFLFLARRSQLACALVGEGQKTPFLRHFDSKMHHFTKTGSGQT
jgi:hypothetical protein